MSKFSHLSENIYLQSGVFVKFFSKMKEPKDFRQLINEASRDDQEAIGLLYSELIRNYYPKIFALGHRKYSQLDGTYIEDAFHEVFLNLRQSIINGNTFNYSGSAVYNYLVRGVLNQLNKKDKKIKRESLKPEASLEAIDRVEPFSSLKECVQDAIHNTASTCKDLIKQKMESKIKKEQRFKWWPCVSSFLAKVHHYTHGETKEELESMAEKGLSRLGSDCRKLLSEFYYQGKSLQELAEEMELQYGTLKNRRYQCLNKLNDQIFELLMTLPEGSPKLNTSEQRTV